MPPPARPLAWETDDELRALAEKLVDNLDPDELRYRQPDEARLANVTIPELRALIEAFTEAAGNHDVWNAHLADGTPCDQRPPLIITTCTISSAKCADLDIAVTLVAAAETTFEGEADFQGATFKGEAVFGGAIFQGEACFWMAIFQGEAPFSYAIFQGVARFWSATFEGGAEFSCATFKGEALFTGATFKREADFGDATFKGEVGFKGATFEGEAGFKGATFERDANFARENGQSGYTFQSVICFTNTSIHRRLMLSHSTLGPHARFSFGDIFVTAGASIELSTSQLKRLCIPFATSPRAVIAIFYRGSLLRIDTRPLWQYPWIALIFDWFGFAARASLIAGEDSTDRQELDRAAQDYYVLRDLFRAQPGTDEHQDICTRRHRDLTYLAMPFSDWGWFKRPWGWFVERLILGYLLNPWRIAIWASVLLIACALIYWVGANEATLTHGHLAPGETVMDRWNDPSNELLGFNFSPLYFSLTTFVTLGYGDFAPLGFFKLITGVEALLGVTLLALFTVAWARKMVR